MLLELEAPPLYFTPRVANLTEEKCRGMKHEWGEVISGKSKKERDH
jgi:hypothetical protein